MEVAGAHPRSAGWRTMRTAPEILELDSTQLEDALRRVEQSLEAKDAALVRAVFESYVYVADLMEDKNTSIRRLRQLFFGSRTEKTAAVVGRKAVPPEAAPHTSAAADTKSAAGKPDTDAANEAGTPPAGNGHGRNGADAYQGAERIDVPHPSLAAGDACPACGAGTVYEKAPGVRVRITVSFRQVCKTSSANVDLFAVKVKWAGRPWCRVSGC